MAALIDPFSLGSERTDRPPLAAVNRVLPCSIVNEVLPSFTGFSDLGSTMAKLRYRVLPTFLSFTLVNEVLPSFT